MTRYRVDLDDELWTTDEDDGEVTFETLTIIRPVTPVIEVITDTDVPLRTVVNTSARHVHSKVMLLEYDRLIYLDYVSVAERAVNPKDIFVSTCLTVPETANHFIRWTLQNRDGGYGGDYPIKKITQSLFERLNGAATV